MRIVALNLKIGPIDIGGTRGAHRVAVPTKQRAGKARAQDGIKTAVDGDNGGAALVCAANRFEGSHLGRAAYNEHA